MIRIQDLTFSYNQKDLILNDLHMTVPKGAIYGFLGANGAGKSTTIRNILGLLKPTAGTIEVMGTKQIKKDYSYYSKIGTLIEAPALYQHLSAIDNLKITARFQHQDYSRIEYVLDRVGLAKSKRKKVANYSMGMKQRLGLAIATLHDPELLILDEPVNGLDPNGIRDVRSFLKDLQESGKTILLSSHLLSEIEKMASHVGIIEQGSLVYEGSMEALNSERQGQGRIRIKTNDIQKTGLLLQDRLESSDESFCILKVSDDQEISKIISNILEAGIDVYDVRRIENSLEHFFMDLTIKKSAP